MPTPRHGALGVRERGSRCGDEVATVASEGRGAEECAADRAGFGERTLILHHRQEPGSDGVTRAVS